MTAFIDATPGPRLGGAVATPILKSIGWLIGITAVFSPLTVARYRNRV